MRRRVRILATVAIVCATSFWAGANAAFAEPHLLSKQYTRCTSCHVSPTGGGLLSSYGRALSATELSTIATPVAAHESDPPREEGFLFGALGDSLGDVQLGVSLRPSRLHFSFPGGSTNRGLLMNADVSAAVTRNGWTFLGTIARKPSPNSEITPTEYWAGKTPTEGLGFRAGRFMPAYGIYFADHTAFNRSFLELAQYDQVLGGELSHARGSTFTQVSLSAGRADSLIDDDGRASLTSTGRVQHDVSPRMSVVGSAMFRAGTDTVRRRSAIGGAFGFAPDARLTIWTQVDRLMREGTSGAAHTVVNETSLEIARGIWFKISPQWYFGEGPSAADRFRLQLGAVLLPRTHWNVNVFYYRDGTSASSSKTHVVLTQLHLYL